ncbi:MAG: ROK family protein [Planctomycetia bacterium]|nr:ROK family protein [Planctomycetia bacterium]
MEYYLGIDLGGTNTKIGVVDDDGNVVAKGSVPTHIQDGPEQACKRIAEGVEVVLEKGRVLRSQIVSAGLASAGTMDIPGRKLMVPANLGEKWNYYPICDRMSEACGFPVVFSNDASAAAFAEFWVGKGKTATKFRLTQTGVERTEEPINSMILLTLGTGIGCGIILNKRVWDGEHSHGGEYGHSIIDYSPDARICGCGKPGHYEAYASATALVNHAREAVRAGRETSLSKRLEALRQEGAKVVAEEAKAGDKVARDLIIQSARYLAVGIVTLMHTIDPDAIYIGGAMTFGGMKSETGREYLQAVREEVELRAYKACSSTTILEFAELGGDAGFIGAAGIAKFND